MIKFYRGFIGEILEYRYFLQNSIKYELKLRYKNTILGVLWVFVSPLLHFIILGFVFSFVLRGGIENYKLFFISGLVPWMMISNAILNQVSSMVNNGELMKKISLPKFIFPLSSNIARVVDNMVFLAILVAIFLFSGNEIRLFHIWALFFMLIIFLTTFGLGLILAVVNVFIRDTQQIVNILFQILFFISPIIYELELIPEKFRIIFKINPFYYYIEVFHHLFYYQVPPSLSHLSFMLVFSLSTVIAALFLYHKTEKRIIFHLSY